MKQESLLFPDPPAFEAAEPHEMVDEDPTESAPPQVLTVTEITKRIKGLLEGDFPDVWVSGEVSGFRPAASGHWYFDLKDEQSVIHVVIFRGINQRFPFKMEDGMALICHGKVDVFTKRGSYQLIVDSAEPKGVGALQLAFEQMKEGLAKEGLFAKERKQRLPTFPHTVGVVTSPTGAAVRDIIQILRRRAPGVHVLVAPARVQGEGAAKEIAEAIALLDQSGRCDVLIVGRGGGSLEDLWAFNEEIVARALATCQTPVVSAVGHEIDFTIADFVADVRAPTPSAAAELVVPDQSEILQRLQTIQQRLQGGLRHWWELRARTLHDLRERLRPPTTRFTDLLLQIDHCRERLTYSMDTFLRARFAAFEKLGAELQHLSPLAVLKKGYAVVTKAGSKESIRDAKDVNVGDKIDVRLSAGKVSATVCHCEGTAALRSLQAP